ncbi:hypothetical protein CEXT_286411 [Caerostris extrusa]|uniref:Uncharacterized protein n=1 Tax=Caerostris extrusa TaxID=172846 RepID=A0AAV4S0M6_CAEEX|nr:hypothetical protein CEXT_286411 [Caerostris extrusa]
MTYFYILQSFLTANVVQLQAQWLSGQEVSESNPLAVWSSEKQFVQEFFPLMGYFSISHRAGVEEGLCTCHLIFFTPEHLKWIEAERYGNIPFPGELRSVLQENVPTDTAGRQPLV